MKPDPLPCYAREVAPPKFPRWVIAVVLPFAVVASYVGTLAHGTRMAFRYARLAAGEEIDAARREWRRP